MSDDDKKTPDCLKPLSEEELAKRPMITAEEIHKIIKEGDRRRKEKPAEAPLLEGICVVCKGKITEQRWSSIIGEPVYGGHNQVQKHSQLHCTQCGLLYLHLPKI